MLTKAMKDKLEMAIDGAQRELEHAMDLVQDLWDECVTLEDRIYDLEVENESLRSEMEDLL